MLLSIIKISVIPILAVPSNDHYLPLMYTLGLVDKNEELKFYL